MLDSPKELKKEPRVLAVVPIYNGEKSVVSNVVKSLLAQDYPFLRIVIIDDYSKESFYPFLLRKFSMFPQVTVLRNEKNMGLAQTLNIALNLVVDETHLLVLEQDCELLSTTYVKDALNHFRNDNVGAVSGENSLPDDEQFPLMKRIFVNHLSEDVHDSSVIDVGFSLLKADIFRIDVLKQIGGFESSAKWKFACEEHLISYKIRSLGYMIIKDSDLRFRAYWGSQEKLLQNLRKEALYGRGLGWALARMRSDLEIGRRDQLKSKMITRIIQAQYVTLTVFSIPLLFFSPTLALIIMISSASLNLLSLVYRATVFVKPQEKILFIGTGFLRSWVYIPNFFFGFLHGLLLKYRHKTS